MSHQVWSDGIHLIDISSNSMLVLVVRPLSKNPIASCHQRVSADLCGEGGYQGVVRIRLSEFIISI